MYESIPEKLKSMPHWICWSMVERDGKNTKIPVNPKTGGNAKSNDPSTWTSYEEAVKASEKYSGIGFMLGAGIFGIDIDDIEEDITAYKSGDEGNVVAEFIHSLGSYAEYSQSGKGIHIICTGKLPAGGRRKGRYEFYESGRFFVMTGNAASDYKDVIDCTEGVKPLHRKYIGEPESIVSRVQPTGHLDMNEQDIVDLAMKSKQGQAFSTLYNGFWKGLYPSQSEADMAFCNMLAFWTQADKGKMDSILRKSGLYRKKWDSKRGASTYGDMVLDKAIADCREMFTPGDGIEDYGVIILDQKKKKRYSYDDTGNADRFVEMFGEQVRYSYIDKGWYFYNGKKWGFDNSGSVKGLTDKVLREMKIERALCEDEDEEKAFDKHLKYTRNNKGKTNMVKEVEHRLAILPSDMDKSKEIFNTFNGVLDLKTGKLMPHDSKQYLSRMSSVEYTDKIDTPMWNEFLDQIFAGDKDLIRYIQKAIGYSMTGSTREQCAFFCFGNGRNGKSTFLEVINEIMGDYATNIQPETIMVQGQRGGANSDIARLKGARFVTTVEPDEGMRLKEGLIKQLTGGDKVTARHLYGKEFEFEPEFKLWMGTNHKPIIRGRDLGIWRRMHLIPFTVQIPDDKVDKGLKYKLRKELPGILSWAVDGCRMWQKEGLEMPTAVSNAVKEYRGEMDVVSAFLDECTRKGPGEVKSSELYNVYSRWTSDNGEYKMSSTKFGKEVALRFNKVKKTDAAYYQGIKINEDFAQYKINLNW